MDEIFGFIGALLFGEFAYRLGLRALKIVTWGRFEGKSSYWPGVVALLGGLIMLSPFIGLLAWVLMRSG